MSAVYFIEEQRLWQNRLLRVGLASGVAFCALRWRAGGRERAFVDGLFCTVAAAFLAGIRLRVRVGPEELEIMFCPLVHRRVPLHEVSSWQVVTYRPVRDYGGWGVRWRPGGRAYTISGNTGVRLRLGDGREILVGSYRPEELADAIARARGQVF